MNVIEIIPAILTGAALVITAVAKLVHEMRRKR